MQEDRFVLILAVPKQNILRLVTTKRMEVGILRAAI